MNLVMWLKIAARIPFGLLAAVSLYMGASEILSGNFSEGIGLLSGAVFFGVVLWFAWNSPFATGGKLVFGGILFLAFSLMGDRTEEDLVEFILGGSALISGLLLLLAAWASSNASE
ncbi:MAG: hypothetical protein WCC12_03985 [Anaerolineales bacterium]